jgi:hypothetical protein
LRPGIKKLRKHIKRKVRLISLVKRRHLTSEYNKLRRESFTILEGISGAGWKRGARAKRQTYANYKRKVLRRFRVLARESYEAGRDIRDRAILIKKGHHKGQYALYTPGKKRPRYLSPASLNRSMGQAKYWARIRWLERLLAGDEKRTYTTKEIQEIEQELSDEDKWKYGTP